jgi:hypothetical protein
VTGGLWSVQFTHLELIQLADGVNNILFTARVPDLAGNVGQGTKTLSKDATPPVVAFADPLAGDQNADGIISQADNDGTFTVNGTTEGVENAQQVTVRVSDGVTTIVRTASVNANAWQLDLAQAEINALSDGDQNITFTADVRDKAGNPATQIIQRLSKNTGGSIISINEPLVGDANGDFVISGPENDGDFTIDGMASPVQTTQGQTVTVRITDGTTPVTKTTTVGANGTWTVSFNQADINGLAEGTDNIQVSAQVTDTAGNPAQDGALLSKDTTAPGVTITMPLLGDINHDGLMQANEIDPTFPIKGTTVGLEDQRQVQVTITDGVKTLTQTGIVAANAWQVDFPMAELETLADGTLLIDAKATDQAGNEGAAPQQQVLKDTTLPTIAINATGAGADNIVNDTEANSFSIDGSTTGVEDNQLVAVEVRDLSGHGFTRSAPVIGNVWTLALTRTELDLLDEGINNITIRANVDDLAGNPAPEAVKIIGKRTLGSLLSSITSSTTNGNYTVGATVNITATMQTDVTVGSRMDVTLDTGAVVTLTAGTIGRNLMGNYSVASGQKSADLNVVAVSNVAITDIAGNPINALQIPTGYNLADNKDIAIYVAQLQANIVRLATADCALTESCQIGDKVQFRAKVWNAGPTALSGQLGAVSFPLDGIGNASILSSQGYGGANWSYTKAVLGPLYVSLPSDPAGTTSYVQFVLEGTALAAEKMSASVEVAYDGDINNLKLFVKSGSDAVSTTTEWKTRPDPSYGLTWSGYMGYLAQYQAPLRVPAWIAIKDNSNTLICGAMAVDWNTATTGYIEVNTAMCMSKLNGVTPQLGATHFVNGGLTLYCNTRYPDAQRGTVWVWGDCIKPEYAQNREDPDLDGFPNIYDNAPLVAASSGECTPINGEVNIVNKAYTGTASCSAGGIIAAGRNVSTGTANVTYTAPRIVLLPGFRAAPGSTFRAKAGLAARPEMAAKGEQATGLAEAAASAAGSAGVYGGGATGGAILPAKGLGWDELPVGLRTLLEGQPGEVSDLFEDALGARVVLATTAPLVAADGNGLMDVYLYDVATGDVRLLSATAAGVAGNGASLQPRMDGGGNYVVFASTAADLVAGDRNGVADIYLYDLQAQQLVRVSYGEPGGEVTAASLHPAIASDRPLVLYDREDEQGQRRIYGYDYNWPGAGTTALTDGFDSHHPAVSADGRYLGYVRDGAEGCRIAVSDLWGRVNGMAACPDVESEEFALHFSDDGGALEWLPVGGAESVVIGNPARRD